MSIKLDRIYQLPLLSGCLNLYLNMKSDTESDAAYSQEGDNGEELLLYVLGIWVDGTLAHNPKDPSCLRPLGSLGTANELDQVRGSGVATTEALDMYFKQNLPSTRGSFFDPPREVLDLLSTSLSNTSTSDLEKKFADMKTTHNKFLEHLQYALDSFPAELQPQGRHPPETLEGGLQHTLTRENLESLLDFVKEIHQKVCTVYTEELAVSEEVTDEVKYSLGRWAAEPVVEAMEKAYTFGGDILHNLDMFDQTEGEPSNGRQDGETNTIQAVAATTLDMLRSWW